MFYFLYPGWWGCDYLLGMAMTKSSTVSIYSNSFLESTNLNGLDQSNCLFRWGRILLDYI